MKYSWLLIFGILLASCHNSKPRRPIHRGHLVKEDYSVVLNKSVRSLEEKNIKLYIEKDSLFTYSFSPYGFSYAKLKQNPLATKTVQSGSTVIYEKTVYNLANQLIYAKAEESCVVGKSNEIKGIQEGLKLMQENEEFKFIFTSFVAHGFHGDENKIGANTPLVVNIKLLKIK